MNCIECKKYAEYKCICSEMYLCSEHLSSHIKKNGKHMAESLCFTLEPPKSENFKRELLCRLNKLKLSKHQVFCNSKNIIIEIESLTKSLIFQLDALILKYSFLIKREHFYNSEKDEIENFLLTTILIRPVQINLEKSFREGFNQSLVSEEGKESSLIRSKFLTHHYAGFRCGVVSKKINILVTGSLDNTVRVWNLLSRAQLYLFEGHTSYVQCIDLAEEEGYAISGSFDTTVRVWDLKRQCEVVVLRNSREAIYSVLFCRKAEKIISGTAGNEIFVFDFNAFTLDYKFCLPEKEIRCLSLIDCETKVMSGIGTSIHIWDLANGKFISSMKGHSKSVWSLVFSGIRHIFVSGSADKTIAVWDERTLIPIEILKGHRATITSLQLFDEDSKLLSASEDKSIILWSIVSNAQVHKFDGHLDAVFCLLPFDSQFISLSRDSSIGFINIKDKTLEKLHFLKPFKADSEILIPYRKSIAYLSGNDFFIWNSENENESALYYKHMSPIQFIEISKDGLQILTGSQGQCNNLVYWSLENKNEIRELKGHSSTVFCGCISLENKFAVTGSGDKSIKVWNLKNCKLESSLRGHTGKVLTLKISENAVYAVSGGEDRKVVVWNLQLKIILHVFAGHNQTIWKIMISKQDDFVVSADVFDGIKIWNIVEKKLIGEYKLFEEAKDWLVKLGIPLNSLSKYLH